MFNMLKQWIAYRVPAALVVGAVLVQLIAPMGLFVFCVGEDGHAGVEFAHNTGACDAVVKTKCCGGEKDSSPCELECSETCCRPSKCSDTALPVYAAVLQVKAQSEDNVYIAVATTSPVLMVSQRATLPAIDILSTPPPLIRSSVLRL